jgi:SAM-dependent methyltransferase
VDLGDGLVTPGDYDYRNDLDSFGFPEDMTGMNVLDVGTATGYFAFEFERRGANVVAVDLATLADWDIVNVEREKILNTLEKHHQTSTRSETSRHHLDGPFNFCHRLLKSKVKRVNSRIYDLNLQKLGCDGFDMVFLGDVLPHLFSPLTALDALAPLCKGTLVVSLTLWDVDMPDPGMVYMGAEARGRSWWRPNRPCLELMLNKIGFANVKEVGVNRSLYRPHWNYVNRPVFHATKT